MEHDNFVFFEKQKREKIIWLLGSLIGIIMNVNEKINMIKR